METEYRTERITITVTESEKELITKYATNYLRRTVSDYIRLTILDDIRKDNGQEREQATEK